MPIEIKLLIIANLIQLGFNVRQYQKNKNLKDDLEVATTLLVIAAKKLMPTHKKEETK